MAGVGKGATIEDDQDGNAPEPSAIRIDTNVFSALTEATTDDGDTTPAIVRWFDCWRR